MKDLHSTKSTQKELLAQVTNVLFPMFKVFTESLDSDLRNAKIRIHSLYNPMTSMLEPTYVVKAKYAAVKDNFERSLKQLSPDFKPGERRVFSGAEPPAARHPSLIRHAPDMFFFPPKAEGQGDTKEAIRVRRVEGLFQIFFYNEVRIPCARLSSDLHV